MEPDYISSIFVISFSHILQQSIFYSVLLPVGIYCSFHYQNSFYFEDDVGSRFTIRKWIEDDIHYNEVALRQPGSVFLTLCKNLKF